MLAVPDNVKLKWLAPASDGNSPITSYIIEKRPSGDHSWQSVGETPSMDYTIPKIAEGIYDFRVIAVNKKGQSAPAELKNVDVQGKMRLPKAPGKPEVSDITDTQATITWPASKEEESAPVDGYNVYLREKGTKKWRKVTKTLVKSTKHVLDNLESEQEYEVQITAQNALGESQPSVPSDTFKTKKPSRKGTKKGRSILFDSRSTFNPQRILYHNLPNSDKVFGHSCPLLKCVSSPLSWGKF